MPVYKYEGPVMLFEKPIDQHWVSETTAISPNRARSNLAYRYKKQMGLEANAKITLPGLVTKIIE